MWQTSSTEFIAATTATAKPLPVGWELVPDTTTEPARTTMNFARPNGDWIVRLSDRSIYGMTAVALLSPAN